MEEHMPEAMSGEYVLSIEELAHAIQRHKTSRFNTERMIDNIQGQIDKIETCQKQIEDRTESVPQWEEIFMETDKSTKRVLVNRIVDKILITESTVHIVYKLKV